MLHKTPVETMGTEHEPSNDDERGWLPSSLFHERKFNKLRDKKTVWRQYTNKNATEKRVCPIAETPAYVASKAVSYGELNLFEYTAVLTKTLLMEVSDSGHRNVYKSSG